MNHVDSTVLFTVEEVKPWGEKAEPKSFNNYFTEGAKIKKKKKIIKILTM